MGGNKLLSNLNLLMLACRICVTRPLKSFVPSAAAAAAAAAEAAAAAIWQNNYRCYASAWMLKWTVIE